MTTYNETAASSTLRVTYAPPSICNAEPSTLTKRGPVHVSSATPDRRRHTLLCRSDTAAPVSTRKLIPTPLRLAYRKNDSWETFEISTVSRC